MLFHMSNLLVIIILVGHQVTISVTLFLTLTIGFRKDFYKHFFSQNKPPPFVAMFLMDQIHIMVKAPYIAHLSTLPAVGYNKKETKLKKVCTAL